MKRIVILTGTEQRHTFFRTFMALSKHYAVVKSYCEGLEKSLDATIASEKQKRWRMLHLKARRQSEADFFGTFTGQVVDCSNPVFLPKGQINSPEFTQAIIDAHPDLLVAYGCSLIREPLLSAFKGRFLNVHLGLSPYYRGSGTNFWPLVNNEPEYLGATFMHIDAGVDTGEIIHQIRARLVWGDTPSQIGNRLIGGMCDTYRRIVENFEELTPVAQLPVPEDARVYRKKDFTEDAVQTLYRQFSDGLVAAYLSQESERCRRVPIVCHPRIEDN